MLKQTEKLNQQIGDDIPRSDLMPNGFEFFNLGTVAMTAEIPKVNAIGTAAFVVTFRITGDELGFCALGFERAPASPDQTSMLLEMANILVAKFATQMAEVMGGSVDISPPHILSADQKRERLLFVSLIRAKELPENSVLKTYSYKPTADSETAVNQANRIYVAYLPNAIGRA